MKHELMHEVKKQAKNISPEKKRLLLIGAAVIGGIGLLIIVALIGAAVWLFNSVNTDDIAQVANEVQDLGIQVPEGFNVQDYIQGGAINTEAIQQQVESFTPQEVTDLQNQINELLQSGQITQQQAEEAQQLLQGN